MTVAEPVPLEGQLRLNTGKGFARRLRVAQRVPAVVYATKTHAALAVDIPLKELLIQIGKNALRKTIFALTVNGESMQVIAKDLQMHPVKDIPTHVDFVRLTDDSVIAIEVPITLTNPDRAPVLKRGGKMQVVTRRVLLRVPAHNIPDAIEYSLAGIDGRKAVHLSDLVLPQGCTLANPTNNLTVFTIKPPVNR